MPRISTKNTKGKIVSAAWKLFYELGYDATTVDDIIASSRTSKGSFYHYFPGKDALLSSLSTLFDDKYEELMDQLSPEMSSFDQLMFLNRELFSMIENTVSVDLMARMYATQLTTQGDKHLLDRNRTYYKLLRKIAAQGQERGEITREISAAEVSRHYAMCERALIYEWCIRGGDYSLASESARLLPLMLDFIRVK